LAPAIVDPIPHRSAQGIGMQPPGLATAKSYLISFLQYTGSRAWISLFVMVLLGLSEGIGLLMLIPFLQLIGFDGAGQSDRIAFLVRDLFTATGLPLTLPAILCVYVFILGLHAVASRYQESLNARMMLGYTQFMQDRLYTAFSRVEWLCFTRTSGTEVIRVLTCDLIRAGFATRKLLELIAATVLTAIYIGVALSVSWVMTLFALACAAVIFLMLQPLNRQAHILGEEFQTAVEDMYWVASEHLGGMKIAKSYSLEDEHAQSFSAVTNQVAAKAIRFFQVDADTKMYHQLGAIAALSAFFYLAANFIPIPSASLLLVVFVFARLSPKVSSIQHYIQHITNSLPAFRAASLMLSRFEAAAESPSPSLVRPLQLQSAIRFSGVSFSYYGSLENLALSKIDLVIQAHKTIALVGPSGSGKTTLADLIMGLLSPIEGTILIDGRPLRGEWLHQWRSSIGYVPQESFLFHDTVRANLLWAKREATEAELWTALRLAAAEAFVSALPQGLDTVLGDRGIRLSGGERQRLALARALLRQPTILLLDEATSSLDTENEQRIHDAIEGLHGELTMVVIAHRLSTIRRADSIVVLERGQVVEAGAWDLLAQKKGGRFRGLLAQQH
jgi:ATP-binding cassette, subfamily C, bacterial